MNGDPAACCAHAGHVSPSGAASGWVVPWLEGEQRTIEDVFRWAEHTGELELEIEAASEHGVYEDAVRAMGELLGGDRLPRGQAATRRVTVAARDRPRLLVELLAELAFLAERDGFVPDALEGLTAGPTELDANVRGRLGDPANLVKAATYHRLRFEHEDGGWRARAVLDV
jgi:SHS2 domain-containing protein